MYKIDVTPMTTIATAIYSLVVSWLAVTEQYMSPYSKAVRSNRPLLGSQRQEGIPKTFEQTDPTQSAVHQTVLSQCQAEYHVCEEWSSCSHI